MAILTDATLVESSVVQLDVSWAALRVEMLVVQRVARKDYRLALTLAPL